MYSFKFLCLPLVTTEEASSEVSSYPVQEQQMTKLEKLTIELLSVTNERTELAEILASFNNLDLDNR